MKATRCIVDSCNSDPYIKGYCSKHYSRQWLGQPMWRKCVTCGASIEHRAVNQSWCSVECKPRCEAPGCDRPRRKRQWCGSHYSRWRKRGSVLDEDQAWTIYPEGAPCAVCGSMERKVDGLRRYCSAGCANIAKVEGRPDSKPCVICGAVIDLTERVNGRRRYANRSTCDGHSKPSHLHKWIPDLIARDGRNCHLCGVEIDFELKYPDLWSSSVDHVIPRSLGGPNAVDNYKLAHLVCNVRRQAKPIPN